MFVTVDDYTKDNMKPDNIIINTDNIVYCYKANKDFVYNANANFEKTSTYRIRFINNEEALLREDEALKLFQLLGIKTLE